MDKTSHLRAAVGLGIPAIIFKIIEYRTGSYAAEAAGNALIFGIVGMLIVTTIYRMTRRDP